MLVIGHCRGYGKTPKETSVVRDALIRLGSSIRQNEEKWLSPCPVWASLSPAPHHHRTGIRSDTITPVNMGED